MIAGYPGFEQGLRGELEAVVEDPHAIQVAGMVDFGQPTRERLGVRFSAGLYPFPHVDFTSTRKFLTAYEHVVAPGLALELPCELKGCEILGGRLEGASMVPRDTLRMTDLEAFRQRLDPPADVYLNEERPAALEHAGRIVDALVEAKQKDYDFLAYVE